MKIILTYHSIGHSRLSISPAIFEKQMSLIANRYKLPVVKLSDLSDRSDSALSITFDDCFLDTFYNAVPILEKFRFPATFYAVPGYDGKVLYGSEKDNRWYEIAKSKKCMPFKFCGPEERRYLVEQGHDIGAHTINHRNLDQLSRTEKELEIIGSIKLLTDELRTNIDSFCFPRGRFDEDCIDILHSDTSIRFISTTEMGYVDDKYLLKRFPVSTCLYNFKSILSGTGGNLSVSKKILRRLLA